MKYLVISDQGTQGCDYTIGCGVNYEFLEADSIESLLEEIFYPDGREETDGYSSALDDDSEYSLENIFIIPAEQVIKVDLERYKKEQKQERIKQKEAKKEKEELELLAKLEEKYRSNK